MLFANTRLSTDGTAASEAIARGVAEDGGLYVPLSFPILTKSLMNELKELSFAGRVAKVISLYADDVPSDVVLDAVTAALDGLDEGEECPLVKADENFYELTLTNGATARADDLAEGIRVRLTAYCKRNANHMRKTLFLYGGRAEVGRTLLSSAGDVEGVAAAALFSVDEDELKTRGILESANCKNTLALALDKKELDDALPKLMNDRKFLATADELGFDVVRANGKHILRILPYVAIFISSYIDLVDSGEIEEGQFVNVAAPSMDLSIVIAACYAKKMGLPIKKTVVATNANNEIISLIYDGEFEVDDLYLTLSPEMDVVVPDNLERLTFELTGRDCEATRSAMAELIKNRSFKIDVSNSELGDFLEAGWADEDDVKDVAFNYFDIEDRVFDAHTAVVVSVYNDYAGETEDDAPVLIVSAVDPFIDPIKTLAALGSKERDSVKAVTKLETVTALECPTCIAKLSYFKGMASRADSVEEVKNALARFMERQIDKR